MGTPEMWAAVVIFGGIGIIAVAAVGVTLLQNWLLGRRPQQPKPPPKEDIQRFALLIYGATKDQPWTSERWDNSWKAVQSPAITVGTYSGVWIRIQRLKNQPSYARFDVDVYVDAKKQYPGGSYKAGEFSWEEEVYKRVAEGCGPVIPGDSVRQALIDSLQPDNLAPDGALSVTKA